MSKIFISYLPAVLAKVDSTELVKLKQAGNKARNIAVTNLRNDPPRTGHRYKKPGTNVYYTASAPGEYPARRFGDLAKNVRYKIRGGALGRDAILGTDQEHGVWLEKKPESQGGREWLRPSLEEARPFVKEIFGSRWF